MSLTRSNGGVHFDVAGIAATGSPEPESMDCVKPFFVDSGMTVL